MADNFIAAREEKHPALIGSLYYFFQFVGAGSFFIFIYAYLSDPAYGINLNGSQIGFLSTLQPLMVVLLSTTIASIADKNRKRKLFTQIGLAGVGIATFLLKFQSTFAMVALLMLLSALFNSPIGSIADSLIARTAQRKNLNYGGMRLWGSFGFVVSSLTFGALWGIFGFKPMFNVAAITYLPMIFIVSRMEEGPVIAPGQRQPFIKLFTNKGLLLLLLATIFASTANSLTMTFNGMYVNYLGGGSLLIGLMTGLGAIGEIPMMFWSDRIGKRLKKTNAILLAYGIMALAFLGFSLTSNPALLPAFNVVKCIGYGLWMPLTIRLFTENTPPEWAAAAQSLLTISMFGISQLIAGPVGGVIYDKISPHAVYVFGILCFFAAVVVLMIATRRNHLRSTEKE